MNEIRKTENAYMDLMSPVLDEISGSAEIIV